MKAWPVWANQDVLRSVELPQALGAGVGFSPTLHGRAGNMVSELPQQMPPAAARSWADFCPSPSPPHLEVVLHVAVGVLGGVQEDEQVLAQVIGHGVQPGQG